MNKETVDKLYDVLTSQYFYEWYTTTMDDHILGEEGAKSTEEIKKDIQNFIK